MRITKPGDKKERKKEIDGYRFTCENCWCEFECNPDEVMEEKFYGWNSDKGETVFETFAYARCPNCGEVVDKAEIILSGGTHEAENISKAAHGDRHSAE